MEVVQYYLSCMEVGRTQDARLEPIQKAIYEANIDKITRLLTDPITVGRRWWGQRHDQQEPPALGSIGRLNSSPHLNRGCHQPTLLPFQQPLKCMSGQPVSFNISQLWIGEIWELKPANSKGCSSSK
jgi:hypothetical protein